jgi:hypothetical protein
MSWLGIVHSLIHATFGRSLPLGPTLPLALKDARVRYASDGRSGSVVFSIGLKSFEMYYEFGGGDTVAIIDVPTREEWVAKTWFALEQRQPILEFIGATVARDQVSMGRGRHEIHDDHIRIIAGGASQPQ